MKHRNGTSTIECLVAVVVFTVGSLGAVATTGLGLRLAGAGDRAAAAARLARSVFDTLRSGGPPGPCPGPGLRTDPSGDSASWSVYPAPGGRDLILVLGGTGIGRDTVRGFLPCR
jgi:hypothetical protein